MERRLIDANAGVELLRRMAINYASIGRLKEAEDYTTTANVLNSSACFPTVDAVEVVRCRECAYMHVPRCCPCQISGFKVDDDWYCPMGVRRKPDGE